MEHISIASVYGKVSRK